MIGNKGYTLIELIIVVALLGVLMMGVTQLFFASIKGTSKANAIARVKEYGSHAQITIERLIRNGLKVKDCGDTILEIENINGYTDILKYENNQLLLNDQVLVGGDAKVVSFLCKDVLNESNQTDQVTINFTIKIGDSDYNRADEILSRDFQISVQLRNN